MWSDLKWKLLSRVWLFDTRGLEPARLLCPWDSPGKNTGVGSLSLLQGIFPAQGLNLGLRNAGGFFTIRATKEMMFLNCDAGEDSWERLGKQGDQTSQSFFFFFLIGG